MGTELGKAVLRLSTDSSKFDKGITSSRQKAEKFTKALKVVGGIAVGLGVTFAALAKRAIDSADNFAKMSKSTGVSTEALSALSHAAKLSGTDMETLEKALGRLAVNASDTGQGIGEAKVAFEQLGISVKDADGNLRPIEEVMLDVADRFSEMEDGTQKTALAMDIFGRSGMALIPMLNEGRTGLAGMMTEAQNLGLVIGTDTARSAERFNDALLKLTSATTGIVNVILGSGLLDGLVVMAEGLADLVVNADKTGGAFTVLSEVLTFPIKLFLEIERVIASLRQKFNEFIVEALNLVVAADDLLGSWSPFKDLATDLQGTIDQFALSAMQAGDEAKSWKDKLGKLRRGFKDAERPLRKVNKQINDFSKQGDEAAKAAKKLADKMKSYVDQAKKALNPSKELTDKIGALEDAGFDAEKILHLLDKEMKEAIQVHKDLKTPVADLIIKYQDLIPKVDAVALSFDAVTTALLEGKDPMTDMILAQVAAKTAAEGMASGVADAEAELDALGETMAGEGGTKAKLGELETAFGTFAGSAKGSLDELLNGVIGPGEFADKMKDSFKNLGINMLKSLADELFTPLLDTFKTLGTDLMTGLTNNLLDPLTTALSGVLSGLTAKLGNIVGKLFGGDGKGGGVTGVTSGGIGVQVSEVAITGVAIQTGIFATGIALTGVTIQTGIFKTGISISGVTLGFDFGGGVQAGVERDINVIRFVHGALLQQIAGNTKFTNEVMLQTINFGVLDAAKTLRERVAPDLSAIRSKVEQTINVNVTNEVNVSSSSQAAIAQAVNRGAERNTDKIIKELERALKTNKGGFRTAVAEVK
ncbi:phage tail tape measure protein [Acidobacteria bacterium AH-259-A15]|nr:phage tail tape measure protein [Acidobacteria bacterium AH-259-A15]